jgi:hypothetical protein
VTGIAATPRRGALELARLLAAWGWVTLATVITIGALGALPGWLGNEPRDVRTFATVEDAERYLGAPLALPSYYPQHLAWPPQRVRAEGGRGGSAELTFTDRLGGRGELRLVQATTPGGTIPADLLGQGTELSSSRTTVGERPARLSRRLVDGEVWQELSWEREGRPLVLRTRGEVEELFRMARSSHLRGRP